MADDTCFDRHYRQFKCEYGCCNTEGQICCDYQLSASEIAAIVIGCLGGTGILIALLVWCCTACCSKSVRQRGRVLQPQMNFAYENAERATSPPGRVYNTPYASAPSAVYETHTLEHTQATYDNDAPPPSYEYVTQQTQPTPMSTPHIPSPAIDKY
ncbi:hypothetical protein ScPMuIL_009392 [Solemya velum]